MANQNQHNTTKITQKSIHRSAKAMDVVISETFSKPGVLKEISKIIVEEKSSNGCVN